MDVAIMDLCIQRINHITTVEMIGELDSVTAPQAQEQILPLAEKGCKILLDMSNVTYMSSAGLRILLLLYRKISENFGKIVIAGLNDEIRDVMTVTGFIEHFHVVENRAAGIKALN